METVLQVRNGNTHRVLLTFDPLVVATIPTDATVLEAKLRVFHLQTGGNWREDKLVLHRLTQTWTEAESTWNCPVDSNLSNNRADCLETWNGGTYSAGGVASQSVGPGATWLELDIAGEVDLLRSGQHPGFLLKKETESQSGWLELGSREGPANEAPRLRIVYEEPTAPDSYPPKIQFTSPTFGRFVGEAVPPVELTLFDPGRGIEPSTFRLEIDDVSWPAALCQVTQVNATCDISSLANGPHRLTAWIADRAGNRSGTSRELELWIDRAAPVVTLTYPSNGAWVRENLTWVTGTVADDAGPIVRVTVNGRVADLDGSTFKVPFSYEDLHPSPVFEVDTHPPVEVKAEAEDAAGRVGSTTISVRVDVAAPHFYIWEPKDGAKTKAASVAIRGGLQEMEPGDQVFIEDVEVPLDTDGRFTREIALVDGVNTLGIRSVDSAGNSKEQILRITRARSVQVEITEPADLALLTSTTTTVRGQVGEPNVTVTIQGNAATVNGLTFEAVDVPLVEGGNLLNVTAINPAGEVGSDSVTVLRDTTAPRITVESPSAYTDLETISIAGMVNDLVAGTVNARDVTVEVAGHSAKVSNRSFLVDAVPLALGNNQLIITATDQSGNRSQVAFDILRVPADRQKIRALAGLGQQGRVFELLPEPLVVEVLDANQQPVANEPVLWKVTGDGTLENGERTQVTQTDAAGRSAMRFRLGSRAGIGNQRVEAFASGYRGPASFLFEALAGSPAHLIADAGDQQVGIAGGRLPKPLVATVTDAGFNRLPGVPLSWQVVQGGGSFGEGATTFPSLTDSDGRSILSGFTLGPEDGNSNNVVEVSLAAQLGGPVAGFTASGWAVGLPAETALTGVVLDNSNLPVEGVTLRIRGTGLTTTSDQNGAFSFLPVPVGTLQLIVDGSTANRPGSWPDLEFEITTISGRNNDLGMPIYLLPLNQQEGIWVDESQGGRLTLEAAPGFALEIEPGSATFPGGSRSGVVSVTAVHGDKIPMVPNFGQQPSFIVTIQPAGTRFDPPARLTLPNVEGLSPGQSTELYSFDHDLGFFVSIGPGTVSTDGARVVSNQGVGVVKAGWHCGGSPRNPATPHNCGQCRRATPTACLLGCPRSPISAAPNAAETELQTVTLRAEEPEAKCPDCNDNDPCTPLGSCEGASCKPMPFKLYKYLAGSCVATLNEPSTYTAQTNNVKELEWSAGGSTPETGAGVASFDALFLWDGTYSVQAGCGGLIRIKKVEAALWCSYLKRPTVTKGEAERPEGEFSFGGFVFWLDEEKKFIPCSSSDKLCLGLDAPKGLIRWDLEIGPNYPRIEIPDDPAQFPRDLLDKCPEVIEDLTPLSGGPPRNQYWVRQFTLVHELFHKADAENTVISPVISEANEILSNSCLKCEDPKCEDCERGSLGAADRRIDSLFYSLFEKYYENAEARADAISNPLYDALIDGLKMTWEKCRTKESAQ